MTTEVHVGPHRISVTMAGRGGPAALYPEEVAGMVLVDSAHEAQEDVLRGSLPWRARSLRR
jgi:hypothetical protein